MEYNVITTLKVSSKMNKGFCLSQRHGISQFFGQYRKVPFCAFGLPTLKELPHDQRLFHHSIQKSILPNFGNTAEGLSYIYKP